VNTVEVQSCRLIPETVENIDLDGVADIGRESWQGPLAINANEGTLVSVRSSIYPLNIPVVHSLNWPSVCGCSGACRGCLDC